VSVGFLLYRGFTTGVKSLMPEDKVSLGRREGSDAGGKGARSFTWFSLHRHTYMTEHLGRLSWDWDGGDAFIPTQEHIGTDHRYTIHSAVMVSGRGDSDFFAVAGAVIAGLD
jgi:hypothetical protein